MTRPGLDATVLSDLAGTLFAALMLILVVLLALPPDEAPAPAEDAVEAGRDLAMIERPVLRADAMVALLAMRRPSQPGLSVDLTESGIVVAGAAAPERFDGRDPDALRRLALVAAEGPVRLYVFSHRSYAAARAALADLETVEISVPRALRAPAPAEGFSPAFLALIARAGTPESFRAGLARLLAAGEVVGGADRVSGRRTGGADHPAADASAGLGWRARLDAVLHVAILGVGLACIAAVEVATSRRAQAQARSGREGSSA